MRGFNVLSNINNTAVDANSFRILGIQAVGNDINLTWLTVGNSTNVVQVAAQTPGGGYTNSYSDVDMVFVPGSGAVITNWVDVGGATNQPTRFYRINFVPGVPPCSP